MYEGILFYVNRNTINLFGKELLLGELSVQILNIDHDQIKELYDLHDGGMDLVRLFEDTGKAAFLYVAQTYYQELGNRLRQYPLLSLLLDQECLLPGIKNPRALLYFRIEACFGHARTALDSILIFHNAISHFIKTFIMPLKNLTGDSLSTAADVLNSELFRMYLPEHDEPGLCPYYDGCIELDFETTTSSSGTYNLQVLEKYTTESLLMLLKVDFYKALEAGHLIRQCEYCGRFFLLTKRLHTKYCDNPAPDNPQYTCAQMGYRLTRRKENPEDDPKSDSLRRCLNRITKDCSRQIITAEDKDLLKAKAEELYHAAKIRSGVTYEEFEESLKSKKLYPLCGVTRKSNPVGHPKKETVRS